MAQSFFPVAGWMAKVYLNKKLPGASMGLTDYSIEIPVKWWDYVAHANDISVNGSTSQGTEEWMAGVTGGVFQCGGIWDYTRAPQSVRAASGLYTDQPTYTNCYAFRAGTILQPSIDSGTIYAPAVTFEVTASNTYASGRASPAGLRVHGTTGAVDASANYAYVSIFHAHDDQDGSVIWDVLLKADFGQLDFSGTAT